LTAEIFEPFFLDTPSGRVFALYRAPADAKGCVLFVPPFAEEMNKSRRQYTETSDVLTKSGFATLTVDLIGTGDSSDEFSHATWQEWKRNLGAALDWARNYAVAVDAIIALRLGCILAAEALAELDYSVKETVFWQPVVSGKQCMTQFLRLRVAASMMDGGGKEGVKELKARLENGDVVEVAGYEMSSSLWKEIEQLDLSLRLTPNLGRLQIAEVGSTAQSELSPVGRKLLAAAIKAGIEAFGERFVGEPFWSATEIVTNLDLQRSAAVFITVREMRG